MRVPLGVVELQDEAFFDHHLMGEKQAYTEAVEFTLARQRPEQDLMCVCKRNLVIVIEGFVDKGMFYLLD